MQSAAACGPAAMMLPLERMLLLRVLLHLWQVDADILRVPAMMQVVVVGQVAVMVRRRRWDKERDRAGLATAPHIVIFLCLKLQGATMQCTVCQVDQLHKACDVQAGRGAHSGRGGRRLIRQLRAGACGALVRHLSIPQIMQISDLPARKALTRFTNLSRSSSQPGVSAGTGCIASTYPFCPAPQGAQAAIVHDSTSPLLEVSFTCAPCAACAAMQNRLTERQ